MFGTTGSFTAVLTVADSPNATNSHQAAISLSSRPRRDYRHPRYLIYPLNQRRPIFNETGTDNENGTLTGAHLTSKLHLHLPKPLVELPTTV